MPAKKKDTAETAITTTQACLDASQSVAIVIHSTEIQFLYLENAKVRGEVSSDRADFLKNPSLCIKRCLQYITQHIQQQRLPDTH